MLKQITILSVMMLTLIGCNEVQQEVQDVENEVGDLVNETVDQTEIEIQELEKEAETVANEIKQELQETQEQVDESIVTEGDKAELRQDAFVALNVDAYEEIYDLIDIDQINNAAELSKSGEIITVNEGTEVRVLETDITEAKVEIMATGQIGYVHMGLLSVVNSS